MSEFEIVKSEYNALGEDNNYKTHYLKTSADQVVGLGRMKSFSYAVGDVVYTDNNMQVALKCTTAGTTSNTELDVSTVSVGESVEDGTCVWSVVGRISDSVPIGTIFAFGANEHPIGYLACDGTAVSRLVYADLFAVIGTTYGAGDGSTTFNLPNLNNNSFLEGDDVVGIIKEAGLPNVYGTFVGSDDNSDVSCTGVFKVSGDGGDVVIENGVTAKEKFIEFNTAIYNSIYGNSATVQPKSVTVKFCIKAYGAITNAGSVELEEMAKDYERIASSYLPLAGGAMTGGITFLSELGRLIFTNPNTGASSNITVNPDGFIVFNNKNIERVEENNRGNYIRFTNGLQICMVTCIADTTEQQVTFPVPFLNESSYLALPVLQGLTNSNITISLNRNSGTTISVKSTARYGVGIVAIGWWR